MKGLDGGGVGKSDSKAHRPPLWPSEANGEIVAVSGDVGCWMCWLCQEKSIKTESCEKHCPELDICWGYIVLEGAEEKGGKSKINGSGKETISGLTNSRRMSKILVFSFTCM